MTKRVRVLVVDDEHLARQGVLHLLAGDPEVEVVGEAADGAAAVAAIRALAPDLVLLDVQMPELDGLEVVRAIGPAHMPAVIFATAYDAFAIAAFEVDAVDYLLKPFDDERFRAALARAKKTLRSVDLGEYRERLERLVASTSEEQSTELFPERLAVRSGGRTHFVRVAEIDWIEAADYYSRLHVGGRAHLVRETMTALAARLDPKRFFRVHRSAIVNLDRVVELRPSLRGDYDVILRDGTSLRLTRGRREKLETILEQRL